MNCNGGCNQEWKECFIQVRTSRNYHNNHWLGYMMIHNKAIPAGIIWRGDLLCELLNI